MCGSIYIVYHHTVQVARAQDWCLRQWAKGKHHRLNLQRVKPPRVQVEVVVCVCVCVCVSVWCGVVWCDTCGWGWECESGKEAAEKRENRKDQL